jgi:tetratricopeptide (TPR) repeat protein
MRSREPKTLDDARKLIKEGTPRAWRRASQLLWNEVDYPGKQLDAHFWMMLALTQSLLKQDATEWWQRATTCPNYEPHMEGDWLRDDGLAALRAGKLELAASFLDESEQFHTSTNRKAVLKMAQGRLHYERGEFEEAETAFSQAQELWESITPEDPEPADGEWMNNNAFHWFKLRAQVKGATLPENAHRALDDSSRARRVRMAFIQRFGKRGNQIDDHVATIMEVLR